MLIIPIFRNMSYIGRRQITGLNLRTIGIHSKQLSTHNLLKPRCGCISQQNRTIMNYFFKRPSLEQYKLRDNIPEPYEIIYRNRFDRYLVFAQVITTVTVIGVILLFLTDEQFFNVPKELTGIRGNPNDKLIYLTAFFGFAFVIQYILYKTPIRIYYWRQQKQYILVFFGQYPTRYKQLRCRVGDVTQLPEKGISPWRDAKYRIKDKQVVLLIEDYFKKPADLFIMMGIQKDPWDEDSNDSAPKSLK